MRGDGGPELALVVDTLGCPYLYEIERETASQLYGRQVGSPPSWRRFVDKRRVVKRNASQHDRDRIVSAQAERDRRIANARQWYREHVAEIIASSTEEAPDA